eukprot:Phypoly_transcript_10806.p1 GENE.Phypoly_transcript_10806~~Phypoly_transcript_10806.p1  ORF type:complete len:396 (+),score=77.87 Phypoly_transcript_10806:5-1192(+)
MSRLFNKNNSSPALPVPVTPKSPALATRQNSLGILAPQIITKSANLKSILPKDSPPPSPTSARRDAKVGGSLILSSPPSFSSKSSSPSHSPAPSTPSSPSVSRAPSFSKKPPPKQTPVFGSSLSSLLEFDSYEDPDQVVPFLVEECICYLNRDEVLKVEGLFRQSGKSTEVSDVKRSYDAGNYITLLKISDVHVVTGLLKLYLRSLPEPVVPFSSYDAFMDFQKKHKDDMEGLKTLISELPLENKVLLKSLCLLLKRASTFEKNSKMNANSLAIVIGPNIMRSDKVDMMKAMEDSPLINFLTSTMIEHVETLFMMPELANYNLLYFTAKRKLAPPTYLPYQEYQTKLEERKKTRKFLAKWFEKRTKPEDLVKRKIFTEFDMASFRNSREYSYGQF